MITHCQARKQAIRHAHEQTRKQETKQGSDQVSKQASTQAGQQTIKRASEQVSRQANTQASKSQRNVCAFTFNGPRGRVYMMVEKHVHGASWYFTQNEDNINDSDNDHVS